MVYALLIISALVALGLNIWQRYMEYFPASKTSIYKPPVAFVKKTLVKNFFHKQPSDQNDPGLKIKIALISGFKKFALSFCLVSLFFSILQAWLATTAYSNLSQQTVLGIETRLHWLKGKIAPFEKFKFFPELALIALLIALASTWPLIERLKLKERYKSLMKGIGFIIGLLTIAVCFTFYGNQFEKTEKGIEGRLQIHNLQVLENNQLLIKDVQELAEQNVAKSFSDAQQVKEIVSQRESANSALDSILVAPNYSFYTNFTLKASQIHAANNPGDDHPGDLSDKIRRLTLDKNVNEAAGKFEQQFTKSYAHWRAGQTSTKQAASRPESPESDYYQDLRQSQYDQYVKSGIVQETSISADDLAAEKTVINEAKSEWFHFTSPVYDKYGELFEKTLDKTYSVTFKGWINGAVENIFSGIPLVGELLDPVHDMLKDMIKEKFKKLMSCIRKKDKSAVINELNATDNEINTALNSKTADLQSWDQLRNQAVSVRETLADMGKQIDAANTRTEKLATSNLEEIKSRDRWQSIRERFARKAENAVLADAPPEPFSSEQWRQFKEVLDHWDHYMHTNKEVWWRDGVKNLENEFTTYINQDAMACGAWGFILQQEDWDGAVNFYTAIAPDATATGKPYFLLKYYCATTGNCTIDDLYTREVDNKGVGTFCPH